MIRKKLRSYRKIFTRDSAQKLYVFRYKNCGNDYYKSDICNNDTNIKSYFSNLNNLTDEIIFKLMIRAFRVKTEIVNFITFSFLFYDKPAKVDLFIKNRVHL